MIIVMQIISYRGITSVCIFCDWVYVRKLVLSVPIHIMLLFCSYVHTYACATYVFKIFKFYEIALLHTYVATYTVYDEIFEYYVATYVRMSRQKVIM